MSILDKLKALLGATPTRRDDAAGDESAPEVDQPREKRENATPYRDGEVQASSGPSLDGDPRLERDAHALMQRGDKAEAIALLKARVVLLARHDPSGTLPCLCKRCLVPVADTAESGGVRYTRDFVVAWHRALFYWVPAELAKDAKRVRKSMRSELRHHLRYGRSLVTRDVFNPFTKQKETVTPRQLRPPVNPFTGKRIS